MGHSTVVLDVDGVRVVTDPLLLPHNGVLRRKAPAPERAQWADPDVVLISHLHHDHAELKSLALLGDVPVLTAPANAEFLLSKGISGARGLEPDEWYEIAPGVEIRLVPAIHGHRPMPHRPNAVNGHLLRAPSLTAWFAGDTSLYDAMGDFSTLAGRSIDLACVPVGGWGARLSGGHMGPEQAAQACLMTGARNALAVHYGTLTVPMMSRYPRDWMPRPGWEFDTVLRATVPDCHLVKLAPGGSTDV